MDRFVQALKVKLHRLTEDGAPDSEGVLAWLQSSEVFAEEEGCVFALAILSFLSIRFPDNEGLFKLINTMCSYSGDLDTLHKSLVVYFCGLPGEVNFKFSKNSELTEIELPAFLFPESEGCSINLKYRSLTSEEKVEIYSRLLDYCSAYYSQHLEILLNAENLLRSKPKAGRVSAERFSEGRVFYDGNPNDKLCSVLESLAFHFQVKFGQSKKLKYIHDLARTGAAQHKKKVIINDIGDIETLPPCLQNAKKTGNPKDGQKMLIFWTLSKFSSSPKHLTQLVQPFLHSSDPKKQKKLIEENVARAFAYSLSCSKVVKEGCCPLSQNSRITICGNCSSPAQFIERQFSEEIVVAGN